MSESKDVETNWLEVGATYVARDPCEETRGEIAAAVEAADVDKLSRLLGSRLSFGTAGLRGRMGAGYCRMNELTVLQATQGLCQHVMDTFGDAAAGMGVVIGYDHRCMGALTSERFARTAAAVFLSKGIAVHLYSDIVATPLVPWAVDQLGAAAGIMVTASHNPKEDNGYKVYWSNGAQIIPPHDAAIAAAILSSLEPWEAYDVDAVREHELCGDPTGLQDAYFTKLASLSRRREDNGATELRFTYTAMHGVGTPFVKRAFAAFGHAAPILVTEQCDADASFPTVAFPNPEEGEGALALAFAAAEAAGSPIVLANDPDADRLAVGERSAEDGSWHVFTGNETAALLAAWQWACWKAEHADGDASKVAMVASTVSSKFLAAMAAAEGFLFEDTLTGFKWMGNRSAQLRAKGYDVIFAYEEAIGFCVGDVVKDKDGVCAAAVLAEMAVALYSEGKTLRSELARLNDTYGHFVTNNSYLFVDDAAVTPVIFRRIRNDGNYCFRVGDYTIKRIRDLTLPGYDSAAPDGRPSLPVSSSNMITFYFHNGAVVTFRTSGTEPKLKYYCELSGPKPDEVRVALDDMVAVLVEQLLQPDVHGLRRRE